MRSSFSKFFIGLGIGCGGVLLALFAAVVVALFLTAEIDIVEVSPDWLTENTNIPCEHLKVGKATHDLDYGDVILLDTEITDREAFGKDLAAEGWEFIESSDGSAHYVRTQDNGQSIHLYITHGENGAVIRQSRY